jgi:hypothetical protein
MFADVSSTGPSAVSWRCPTAPCSDRTRALVFVAKGNGVSSPGRRNRSEGGRVFEIRKGLRGEEVVTQANFLIDSESRLKSALGSMTGPAGNPSENHDRKDHLLFRAQPFIVLALTGFAIFAGIWSITSRRRPAGSPETQVIVYSRWDRSPDIIEDQVPYPIITRCSARRGQGHPRFSISAFVRLRDLR